MLVRASAESAELLVNESPFDFDSMVEDVASEANPPLVQINYEDISSSELQRSLEEAMRPLYPGSKIDVVSFMLFFFNICHNNRFLNTRVNAILALLTKQGLSAGHTLPKNLYATK